MTSSTRCDRCGRLVRPAEVAHDAFDGHPVIRWIARKSRLAPTPIICPSSDVRGGGYHRVDGSRIPPGAR